MYDWTDEFDIGLGIDGFWYLYQKNKIVFSMHDDRFPDGISEEDCERMLYMINVWDVESERV